MREHTRSCQDKREDTLEEYTRELIAVGAAVCTNCQPCLKYLVEKARGKGAREEDIAEAVRVGGKIRDGAARKMDGFADAFLTDCTTTVDAPVKGCGCS